MKSRPYNFGAGPAALPESVLLEAQAELLNWQGRGLSILETGHRTPEFQQVMQEAEADFRALLSIPDDYHVLFLGGAARTQFAMVPMNLMTPGQQAGYLISGLWSSLAFDEACKVKSAYCIANSDHHGFRKIPDPTDWQLRHNTTFIYYTPNETVNGVRFPEVPKTGDIPLVADMTSCLLSEPLDISKFGLIFAGAQKNIAPAGLTVVIVRASLLETLIDPIIPTMMDYRTHVIHKSLYATPPVFNCYMAAKMFKWIKAQGGVPALYKINCEKAAKLYDFIDSSPFYQCLIEPNSRSLMNVCFSLVKPELEDEFLIKANLRGLCALKGHRMVGGLRASLYNAMPIAGVDALIKFMQDFAS